MEKKVYLAFYKPSKPKSLWHRTIEFFDRSPYTHVEIAIESEKGYDCYSSSHTDGGVRKKKITLKSGKWTLYRIDIKAKDVEERFALEAGKKYDYLGLLSTKLHFIPSGSRKWFCSELCASVLGLSKPHTYGIKKLLKYAEANQIV